jgi:protein-tyrosine phosphatase
MIDIHNHILFDIDDGSQNIEQSINMCRDAYNNGYKAVVCTPHFVDYNDISDFLDAREEKAHKLRKALREEEIPLEILLGAEVFLTDDIFTAENLDDLTINGSRYLLCEFPLGPFNVNKVTKWIDELFSRGYHPIIAHPERYVEFHRHHHIIDELLSRKVIFQVNADSLAGKNGREPQMMATDMVARGLALLIGTDAHEETHRHTRFKERVKQMPYEISEEMIETCCHRIPKRIIFDRDIF